MFPVQINDYYNKQKHIWVSYFESTLCSKDSHKLFCTWILKPYCQNWQIDNMKSWHIVKIWIQQVYLLVENSEK